MPVSDTRLRLLLAAEKLFALEGVDAASLRRVAAEAGQRNNAALHYHFGDREAVVRAVIEFRAQSINAHRRELLGALEAAGETSQLPSLVHAWVEPNAALLRPATGGGGNHMRFLSQLFSHGRGEALLAPDLPMPAYQPAFEVVSLIRRCVPDLPPTVFAARARLAAMQIVHACAAEALRLDRLRGNARKARVDGFVQTLVEFLVGAFAAPSSV